ncbi:MULTISPECIES: ABC transporter ATP-binding protein [unclassified Cryobacterium]|uniref:ABC transporter ATP-binding protein n=1 Tax=unclassified Cryobacterium TaxID=2649013 RepID=UPI002B231EF7|nr:MULTISPECIES: ABC transporter ATP-binding protein [unclassified Cryobacterium]MEB0001032.1 ABC transporter ATP-binding protein [Cryobacterium sp. RTS3]MEB0267589.1 ABC transporter ATP-binding protein [Cryobacterium sp. 10I5]
MAPASTLSIHGLSKRYRGRAGVQANDGISFDVAPGSVVGLLGHNGAGKTTLVNQVVGLVKPDAGSIRVEGIDAAARPHLARRLVSIQAQANVPITGLTPRRAIELVGRIRGASCADATRRTEHLLDALELGPWADTPAQKVSGGIARLTSFAMTAVVPGRLVVLDEPTNDVDPVRRRLLWDQIRELAANGSALLLVTHNVREAERVVDHLVVLDHGRVIAAGTPAGLTEPLHGALTVEIHLAPGQPPAWPSIISLANTLGSQRENLHVTGTVRPDHAVDFVQWAQAHVHSGGIERYALTPASLEDVYIQLVGTDHATDSPNATGRESAEASDTRPDTPTEHDTTTHATTGQRA